MFKKTVVHTQKAIKKHPGDRGTREEAEFPKTLLGDLNFGEQDVGQQELVHQSGGQETGRRGNTAVSPGASGRTYWPCLIHPHPGASSHGTEGLGTEQEGEGRPCHGLSRYGPGMVTNCRQEDYREGGRHSTRPPGHQACPQQGCVSDGAWGSSLQTEGPPRPALHTAQTRVRWSGFRQMRLPVCTHQPPCP